MMRVQTLRADPEHSPYCRTPKVTQILELLPKLPAQTILRYVAVE